MNVQLCDSYATNEDESQGTEVKEAVPAADANQEETDATKVQQQPSNNSEEQLDDGDATDSNAANSATNTINTSDNAGATSEVNLHNEDGTRDNKIDDGDGNEEEQGSKNNNDVKSDGESTVSEESGGELINDVMNHFCVY